MTLSDLRTLVGNLTDYDPNTTAYNADIDRLINDTYLAIYAEHPWSFAQREVQVFAYPDVVTAVTVTNASTTILSGDNLWEDWMEGQVIEVEGVEYEIAEVTTATTAYLTIPYQGTSGNSTGTVKNRYVDLPENCVEVMQVSVIQHTASDQTLGRICPLSRYEGDHFALSYNDTGTPVAWLQVDPATVRPPAVVPVLATQAGTAWPAGEYEIAVGYNRQNRYSGPSSKTLTYTSDGVTAVVPTLTFGNTTTGSGYRRTIYLKPPGFSAFRLSRDNISEGASTVTVTTTGAAPDVSGTWEFQQRAHEHGGVYQRIRLSPRQGAKYSLTVRYLARPSLLIEDQDQPEMPEPEHHVISEACLTEVYAKSDQLAQSEVYRRKAILTFASMEARYLSQRPRRWVKQGWNTVGYGLRPNTTITHSG